MDIPLVSPRKLDQYVARYPGVWIVDVRSGEEYRRSHIRYAVNIPYEPGKEWDLPGEKEIVVYSIIVFMPIIWEFAGICREISVTNS